ncbi:DUF937 domain-containing protein [Flavobacterium sp. PL12]|uniref:DUF937 domain-containing protein n=1 Tax=Flavobacterium sp. PL12 TaxID=3071718 RepID=UPI00319E290F
MAGLMDLLDSDLGQQIISIVSQRAGTTENETSSVLSSALPTLLGAMQNNAATPEGKSGLLGALLGGKHDGGILDNLSGFLGGADLSDGSNILGQVLGGNQPNVENNLSQNTGVSSDKIGMILKMAAPILMAYLAKNAKQSGINKNDESSSGGGISDILGGLLGGNEGSSTSGAGGLLTSSLDQNGDGKLTIDDAVSAASKYGEIGGIFGKIFGK